MLLLYFNQGKNMSTIDDEIMMGGYESIDSFYHNISEYNSIVGGTIEYRRRVGGKTSFAIRDNMINMSLINDAVADDAVADEDTIARWEAASS